MKVKVITIFILFILMILWGVTSGKIEGLRIFFWKPAAGVPAITVILLSFVVGIIVGGLLATLGRAEKVTKTKEERKAE